MFCTPFQGDYSKLRCYLSGCLIVQGCFAFSTKKYAFDKYWNAIIKSNIIIITKFWKFALVAYVVWVCNICIYSTKVNLYVSRNNL